MQKEIEVYKIPQIWSGSDYKLIIIQLAEKLSKDQAFFDSLEKDALNYKQNELNLYKNYYLFSYCKLKDIEMNALLFSSFKPHRYKEIGGWFLFPIEEEISISGFDMTHDEKMTEIYDKYFDYYFRIAVLDEIAQRFYFEAVAAYKNGCFYACICSLFPILEWYTRRLSQFNKNVSKQFSVKERLSEITNEITNKSEQLSPNTIKVLQDTYTRITEFVKQNYYKMSQEKEDEPEIVCRNRIMHGIFTRMMDKTDCLKLFHIIKAFNYLEYTYVSIKELNEFRYKIDGLKEFTAN